ncbi:hypothetical protein BC941DRAFT_445997 [Chlamydoabsidia padenii]|nr:hypothetical protein BC941DRAFT_445997 [Chlamydoabsidia padenii]
MDIATRKKLGVERQTTFGPSAPIDEWELEKATILREAKENKERAERLQQKLEQDQLAYERNTASLLKEVKLKETSWEKRRQETDENWMNQILELQRQLESERREYEDTIQDTKSQMEHSLQAEQQKYDRRMANLHQRLEAKEKALQQYLSTATVTISQHTPPSPITPSTPNHHNITPLTSNTDLNNIIQEQRQQIQQLQQQLIKQRRRNDVLEQQVNTSTHALSEPTINDTSLFTDADRQQLEDIYNKKVQALMDTHLQEQQRLRDNFMNENSGLTLHMEARLQNIQNEYETTLQEVRDQFAAEKKVWQIEHQATIDQLRRQLEQQYMDELKKEERSWRNKLEDMEASLSKDASETQSHWQTRINTLVKGHDKEMVRLRGELDVVKARLGKDIDRRHHIQAYLATVESNHKKERHAWTLQKQQLEQSMEKVISIEKVGKGRRETETHCLIDFFFFVLSKG